MFSADTVHNAFMDSTRKERMAFEKAAAGAADYKTADECLRAKGLEGCACTRCKRSWGAPRAPPSALALALALSLAFSFPLERHFPAQTT